MGEKTHTHLFLMTMHWGHNCPATAVDRLVPSDAASRDKQMLLDPAESYVDNGEKLNPVFTDLNIHKSGLSSELPEAQRV